MKSYEEAVQDGYAHAELTKRSIQEFKSNDRHPFIGFLKAFKARLNNTTINQGGIGISGDALKGSLPKLAIPAFNSPKISMPNLKSPARKFMVAAAAVPVLYGVAYASTFAAPQATEAAFTSVAQWITPSNPAKLVANGVDCAKRIKVYDENNKYLGYYAPKSESCDIQQSSHRTVSVTDQAKTKVTAALKVLEGNYFGNGSIFGFHLESPARWALSKFSQGGSTPFETAQKNALGIAGGLTKPEKISSVLTLPSTAAHFAPTEDERDRFVAENTPCITGGKSSALGGVLAGDFCGFIFKRPSLGNPTWGEACMVAAAAKYLVRILGTDGVTPDDVARQVAQWNKTKHRAKICLVRLGESGTLTSSAISEAKLEIEAMQPPAPMPAGHFNPDHKILNNAPGLKTLSLSDAANLPESGVLKLTLNGNAQRVTAAAFQKQVGNLLQKTANRLCYGANCADAKQLDFAMYVGEIIEGKIETRIHFETRHNLISGPTNGSAHRSLGSLLKAILAPLIANAGVSKICRRPIYELHDTIPKGFSGSYLCSKYTSPMKMIYAISSNIGIANALQSVPITKLKSYLNLVSAEFNAEANEHTIKRGVTVGNSVVSTPLSFIHSFAAIGNGGQVRAPTLVQQAEGKNLSLIEHVDIQSIRTAKSWLAGPVESYGTASVLGNKLRNVGCVSSLAKTGTSDSVVQTEWRDKLIGFVTKCNGRVYVAFAMIGSPDINIPLGSIVSRHLVNVMWPGFKSLIRKGVRT